MKTSSLAGLVLALLPCVSAQAAPATPEEAARLQSLFARYVGAAPAGEPPGVTVAPAGEAYRATIDIKAATRGLAPWGITFDPSTSVLTLTPLPDGTWKVEGQGSPPIVAHLKDQTVEIRDTSTVFSGIFDPKIAAFKEQSATYTGSDLVQTAPTSVQNRHIDKNVVTSHAEPAGPDAVTVTARQEITGLRSEMIFRSPAPAGGSDAQAAPPAPSSFGYAAPTGAVDVAIDHLRLKNLLDIWAFLVAHPTHEALAAAQDDLRGLLRAALPLAGGTSESGVVTAVKATTPLGEVSAKQLSASFGGQHLDGTAALALGLAIDDLVVPTGPVPAWGRGFVPNGLALSLSAEGLHLAEGGKEAVDDFDLKAEKPFTPEQSTKIGHLIAPAPVTVKLLPSRLTSPLIDLKFDGQATLGDEPEGHLTIHGTGLDKAIASLQTASQQDPSASQVLGPLLMAKNLGKAEADGSLTWVLAIKGKGPVTVNGTPLQ